MKLSLVPKAGFSLVEVMVVMAIFGAIMTSLGGILLSTFKAKQMVEVNDKVRRTGNLVLEELRRNTLSSTNYVCAVDHRSVMMVSNLDWGATTFRCDEGSKIASASASIEYGLTSSELQVSGCDQFAICNITNGLITSIDYQFYLGLGDSGFQGESVKEKFETRVVVRN